MEAAAVGIAKTALNWVVNTTLTAITNEIGLLLGVQEELFFIKEELQMMHGFLQAASTEKMKDVMVNIWVEQVQELAFDVEDCLQEASVHLMTKSCLPIMCPVKKREHIARKIQVLKTRVEDVSKRNLRYSLIKKDIGGHTYDDSASTKFIANVEALIVGLDKPKKELVKLIEKDHEELKEEPWKGKVISVVGMGGLGKSTLVREVYGCQELRDKFMNFAWVTIQHPFHKDEFIESLYRQVPPNTQEVDKKRESVEGNKMNPGLLPERTIKEKMEGKVKEYLKYKYLIVLDDLSSVSEFDKIKDVLPIVKGSRIIVTTRLKPLAESISQPSENIYEIKKLSKHDAFDLFYKVVYKTPNYILVSDEGSSSIEITKEDSKVHNRGIFHVMNAYVGRNIFHNMEDGSSSMELTKQDSEVVKLAITNSSTNEADRKMKYVMPYESNRDMEYVTTSNEITEEDTEVQTQGITNTNSKEVNRKMNYVLPYKSNRNMKYGSISNEITKEDSEVQKQGITIKITKDMKIQAGLIIESCGLLPLAIVTIGSYLATKPKTSAEWKTMHDHLSSELANNQDLGVVKTILTSSYDGMPYHLKPCLLYLSLFHNRKEIRRSRIIRRWMADGYVMQGRKKTADEIAKGYFNDLIGRNLIQPLQKAPLSMEMSIDVIFMT